MAKGLPKAPFDIAEQHPDLWAAYGQLGEAAANAGPLNARERRLVKLALAIGAASEGAVHSHSRRGLDEGLEPVALDHVALLAIPTLGFPRAVAARTWIHDVIEGQ